LPTTPRSSSTSAPSPTRAVSHIPAFIVFLILGFIEYLKILQACAMGFLVIGFIGYIIKLVFIPINNIILGA
jgi:hypothetical protein